MALWLLKSEPFVYSFNDLLREGEGIWDGVRNYQARNNLAAMKPGDEGLFYHSNQGKEVVGLMRIVSDPFPENGFPDGPWVAVRVQPIRTFGIRFRSLECEHILTCMTSRSSNTVDYR